MSIPEYISVFLHWAGDFYAAWPVIVTLVFALLWKIPAFENLKLITLSIAIGYLIYLASLYFFSWIALSDFMALMMSFHLDRVIIALLPLLVHIRISYILLRPYRADRNL